MKSLEVYEIADHPINSTTLSTCELVDEMLMNLKSMENYNNPRNAVHDTYGCIS